MSSWDSMGSTGRSLKVKGTNVTIPILYRCLYDTPCMVGYSLMIDTQELENTKQFTVDTLDEFCVLRYWEKENNSIDTRSMSDSDIYDLFSASVEKYADKLEKEGLSVRQVINLFKKDGIAVTYSGPKE